VSTAARPYTTRAVRSEKDWKWRLQVKSGNGQIVAMGHQAYTTKGSAERAAESLAAAEVAFVKLPREPRS
jgi:uncharacterized protein YegP (UPF0339 family)